MRWLARCAGSEEDEEGGSGMEGSEGPSGDDDGDDLESMSSESEDEDGSSLGDEEASMHAGPLCCECPCAHVAGGCLFGLMVAGCGAAWCLRFASL